MRPTSEGHGGCDWDTEGEATKAVSAEPGLRSESEVSDEEWWSLLRAARKHCS